MARIDKKFVRVVAIVLTIAMLMTTCLVQAFAATSVNTTYYGYSVSANVTYSSTPRFTFSLTYGIRAGLEMDMYADFHDGTGRFESPSRTKYKDTLSTTLTDYLSPMNPVLYNCGNYGEAECWVIYDGAYSPRYYVQKTVQW